MQWSDAEKNAYWQAVNDARTPNAIKLKPHTGISPDNPNQHWNHGLVSFVSWASNWQNYQDNQQRHFPILFDRDVWVTVVPELQSFCSKYVPTGGVTVGKRLIQLLGLSLGDDPSKREMVEFWVDPQFLFRPSFNPEITSHEAGLQFSASNPFLLFQLSYYQWFSSQFDQSYKNNGQLITRDNKNQKAWAYPWTQLGYTYDWGDPSNHLGSSEFVIRRWSPVLVDKVQDTDSYCSKAPLKAAIK